jgi:hypothetical protein
MLTFMVMMSIAGGQPQTPQTPADASRVISDGGVFAQGWTGQIDATEAAHGMVLANAKLRSLARTAPICTLPPARRRRTGIQRMLLPATTR